MTKASNTFNNTTINEITCDQRYRYQHGKNILKKYPIQENIQGHILGQPNQTSSFLKVIPTGMVEEWKIKNDAITDDTQKGCVNGNKICTITKER